VEPYYASKSNAQAYAISSNNKYAIEYSSHVVQAGKYIRQIFLALTWLSVIHWVYRSLSQKLNFTLCNANFSNHFSWDGNRYALWKDSI